MLSRIFASREMIDEPEPLPNCWFCTDCGEMFDRPVQGGCPDCGSLYIERSYSETLAEAMKGWVNIYAL